jgi:hypothetical protein
MHDSVRKQIVNVLIVGFTSPNRLILSSFKTLLIVSRIDDIVSGSKKGKK